LVYKFKPFRIYWSYQHISPAVVVDYGHKKADWI